MRVFRSFENLTDEARGAVVAIGNFDGLHLGHQTLLDQARKIARDLGVPLAILTFEPHPRMLFRADDPPFRLTLPRIAKPLRVASISICFTRPSSIANSPP